MGEQNLPAIQICSVARLLHVCVGTKSIENIVLSERKHMALEPCRVCSGGGSLVCASGSKTPFFLFLSKAREVLNWVTRSLLGGMSSGCTKTSTIAMVHRLETCKMLCIGRSLVLGILHGEWLNTRKGELIGVSCK